LTRSNFLGTSFQIKDDSGNETACVLYETNIFGLRGPRKMTLLLPGMGKDELPVLPTFENGQICLLDKFQANNLNDVLVLHNKQPQWNEESQSYVLNFGGRVTLASVKNFQVVHDLDCKYN
jgi:hypothetical protein